MKLNKVLAVVLAVAVLVPTSAVVGWAQACKPACSENPKVMERDFNEAFAEFKGGQVQAGGFKPIELEPNQEVSFSVPSGTKNVTITAGDGDLTYTLTRVVGVGARATRTQIASGAVAAKQSARVAVPAFDRTKQESVEISVTAGSKKTTVTLAFEGAAADETGLPRSAVQIEISNQGPGAVTYEVKDALGRTVRNGGREVKGSVPAGQKVVVDIEESQGPSRILQVSTGGQTVDARVDMKIYFQQIPAPEEVGKGIYATTIIARPRTLNPITATDTASFAIIDRLHDTLLDGPVGAETGAIAESFEVTPDRKTVTYTLRRGIKFNDGTPITSEDVRFTFENLVYPRDIATSIRDTLFCKGGKDLPTVKVIDERKISFTCPEPAANVPFPNTGFVEILSKRNVLKLAPNVERSPRDFNNVFGVATPPADLVGAGLFRLTRLDPNAVAEFAANPNSWRVDEKGNQLPYLRGLRIILAPTQGQELALQQFRNGQTDLLGPRPGDIPVLQSDKAAGRLPVNDDIDSGQPVFGTEFWVVSWTAKNPTLRAAFANKQVRQAFSHATDRASVVKNIRLGLGTELYGHVSIPSPYYIERPGQKAEVLAKWEQVKRRFDLAKAAQILDSLGIRDTNNDGIREIPANFRNDFGPQTNPAGPFKFILATNVGNTLREEQIKLIASDLKKIGIEAVPTPVDFAALVDQLTVGDYEAILIGLTGGASAASGINVYTCDGNLHFWNVNAGAGCAGATEDEKKLDALYRQLADETDEAKLRALADEAQLLFTEFLPYIPISVGNGLSAYRLDTIRNHQRSQFGTLMMLYCKGGRCRGG
ncbi:MAG: ABC transporter substrate-binding protein [Candidatus Bipolaricaulota bacterium]|nr:ABC transporter substrate-binding protein [Candidatus Bipolaricaulota bacterium]